MKKSKEYKYPNNSNFSAIWTAIWPVLVYLGASVIAGVIVGIFGIAVLHAKNYEKFLNSHALIMNIISQIVSLAIFLPVYLKTKKYIPGVKVSLKKDIKSSIVYILAIVGLGCLSGLIMTGIEQLIKMPDGGMNTVNDMLYSGSIILSFITIVVLAPILEEIMFRGIIFNILNSKMNTWAAIIISALIFGAIHMNIIQGINAFILGLALAYIYSKTHNLYTCIWIHFINNLLSVITQKINYATSGSYVPDTVISIIIQSVIIVVALVLVIKNKQLFKEEKSI